MAYRRQESGPWRHPRLILASLVALAVVMVLAARVGAAGAPRRSGTERLVSSSTLVVNEVDVDQPGTDTAEFVELLNVSASSIDLDPYAIELVNGDLGGAVVYRTIDLPSFSLAPGDFYVVCGTAANVPNCDLELGFASNVIQNGAPDAVAVVNGSAVEDTVSYEGDTGLPYTEGSGTGLVDDGATAGQTLSRYPNGTDTDQNNQDLSVRCASPGSANLEADTGCTPATQTPSGSATFTPTPTATANIDQPTNTPQPPEATTTDPPATVTPDPPTLTPTDPPSTADPPTATDPPPTATSVPAPLTPTATTAPPPGATSPPSTPTPEYLAVELYALSAQRVGRSVYLRWRTASEIDNAGFHVWRAVGPFARLRVTSDPMSPRGSSLSGAAYVYRDAGAPAGRVRYWIEDVDTTGVSTLHGPVTAPAWRPNRKLPVSTSLPRVLLRVPALEVPR